MFSVLCWVLIILIKRASTLHTVCTYLSASVHVCCTRPDGEYRCSIIQSISLGFKALTETRFLPPPPPPPPPPPSLQRPLPAAKYYQSLPGEQQRGKRDLEERGESSTTTAASKSQQPGEGVWVIFYGWRGTADVHLFISTVSIDACARVCPSVCVCV